MSASAKGVFATMVENSLPPSFQRGERSTLAFMIHLHSLTKRELRQRKQALMKQMADLPMTIEEQLAARKRAANVVGMIADGLAKAASDLAEKQALTGRGTPRRTEK
jgi:hypothetical protein